MSHHAQFEDLKDLFSFVTEVSPSLGTAGEEPSGGGF